MLRHFSVGIIKNLNRESINFSICLEGGSVSVNKMTNILREENARVNSFLSSKFLIKGLMRKISLFVAVVGVSFIFHVPSASSNNLSISNVALGDRNPVDNEIVVKFLIQWENSWKTKINHDSVWLTVRLYNPAISPTEKKLCQISASGLNPSGTSVSSGAVVEIYVPSDKQGVFIRPNDYGSYSSIPATDVELTVDYSTCGFSSTDQVYASVFGIEMVYVPEGAFYAGDSLSVSSFDQGSADTDPWQISSNSAISVTNASSNGYRYVSGGNFSEDPTGSVFTIPSSFPKGYESFYVMKYELTEGQWVDFINSLGSNNARVNRDLTDNNHKNSDIVVKRNTIACSGSPLICTTERPARPVSFLSWSDLSAFLDWAALRPMSELEFEKMARGPLVAIPGEFAWGTIAITPASAIGGVNEDGTEAVTDNNANAVYDNAVFSGGDSVNGAEYAQGPLRAGVFATSSTDRITSGAGYYGVLELSGNLGERIVTIGNSQGRNFSGSHGDGILTLISGYEGNATNNDWPGIDVNASYGVTSALGSGFRGGSWGDNGASRLQISDRQDAANGSNLSYSNAGGRGVRTDDE